MPLQPGKSKAVKEANFHELKHGKQYAKTKKKHGASVANKQMVAEVLREAGESKPGNSSKRKKGK